MHGHMLDEGQIVPVYSLNPDLRERLLRARNAAHACCIRTAWPVVNSNMQLSCV